MIIDSLKKVKYIYKICKKSESNFFRVLILYYFYKLKGKNIICHPKTNIKGIVNITTTSELKIGLDDPGFVHNNDITYLNVNGTLNFLGNSSIGRGCRFDIGEHAKVTVGNGTYINHFTKLIIKHCLEIGNNCAISWDCSFLDEDFHNIYYEGKKAVRSNGIKIGNNVWIGANVSLYKGVEISNGSIVAANSVVKSAFVEENVLIAGNPATIVKRNVKW